jgi:hypothetical protein
MDAWKRSTKTGLRWFERRGAGKLRKIAPEGEVFSTNMGPQRLTLPPILGIFRRFDKSGTVCKLKSHDSAERFPGWVCRKASWQTGSKPQKVWLHFWVAFLVKVQ